MLLRIKRLIIKVFGQVLLFKVKLLGILGLIKGHETVALGMIRELSSGLVDDKRPLVGGLKVILEN
jgi:hypothetical protein